MKLLRALFGFCLLLFVGFANAQDQNKSQLNQQVIVDKLNHPWAVEWLTENQILISERNGDLVLFNPDDNSRTKLEIPALVYRRGQGGVLDLKKHPNYHQNSNIYITFSIKKSKYQNLATTALARFNINKNKIENYEILYTAKPWQNSNRHFGSRIVFDQNNLIYFSVGDRGNRKLAQDLTSDLGKIIYLQDDGNFVKNPPFKQNPAVFSYGHRNPQGLLFHNGILYEHEHGPRGGDEVNIIEKGSNYGWAVISYGKEYLSNRQVGEGVAKEGMEQPLHYWTPSIAPSGFDILIKKDHPWHNDFFVGSLKFGYLERLELKNNKVVKSEKLYGDSWGRVREVNIRNGDIYILTDSKKGKLIKLNIKTQ